MILDGRPPRPVPVFQISPAAERAQPARLFDASVHAGRRAREPLAGLTAKKIILESY